MQKHILYRLTNNRKYLAGENPCTTDRALKHENLDFENFPNLFSELGFWGWKFIRKRRNHLAIWNHRPSNSNDRYSWRFSINFLSLSPLLRYPPPISLTAITHDNQKIQNTIRNSRKWSLELKFPSVVYFAKKFCKQTFEKSTKKLREIFQQICEKKCKNIAKKTCKIFWKRICKKNCKTFWKQVYKKLPRNFAKKLPKNSAKKSAKEFTKKLQKKMRTYLQKFYKKKSKNSQRSFKKKFIKISALNSGLNCQLFSTTLTQKSTLKEWLWHVSFHEHQHVLSCHLRD